MKPRIFWSLLLVVFFLAGCRAQQRQAGYRVTVAYSSIRHSNFFFIPEHWGEPQLQLLREQENFRRLRGRDTTDLFLKLCHWVHVQWKRSVPDPYPRANALEILREIRAGRTGGFCGQYAYVLADVLKSLGFFCVRYVELWNRRGGSHFVVEAWNDDLGKWMVLDPDQDLAYFTAEGTPASAMEVRAGLLAGRPVEARSAGPEQKPLGRRHMEYYAHFAVSLRSDLMRSARAPTVGERFHSYLFFRDSFTDLATFRGRIPYTLVTERAADIYPDCNSVRPAWARHPSRRALTFRFFTESTCPAFRGFVVRPHEKGDWVPIGGDSMVVDIDELPVSFAVATVNRMGRRGRVNRVVISRP